MPFVTQSIGSLNNGVSQQTARKRLENQVKEQINSYPSLVDGNKIRPPMEYVAQLYSSDPGEIFAHYYDRDPVEKYAVTIKNGDLKVHNIIDGSEKTVAFPNGKGYLANTTPLSGFAAVTIADYTFILNKSIVAAMKNTPLTGTNGSAGIIAIKQAINGVDYVARIVHNSITYTATTTTASTGTSETQKIAANLRAQLISTLGAGWTVRRDNYALWVIRDDGTPFTLSVDEASYGNAMFAFQDSVQQYSLLPNHAPHNYVVQVKGDNTSNFNAYYVKFTAEDGFFGVGTWSEAPGPGIKYQLDPATMPHKLVRESNGTFTFSQIAWVDRNAGDEESNPNPSFIGRKINDLSLYSGRLSFIADDTITLSEAGQENYFSFFRTKLTALLDSDRIEVAASHNTVSIYRFAEPYNGELFLFTDSNEQALNSNGAFTPSTARIGIRTQYGSSQSARPKGQGRNLYFTKDNGEYSLVREYIALPDTEVNEAADITQQVPRYVSKGVSKIAPSKYQNTLCLFSPSEPQKIYNYVYFFSGTDKLQSAWSTWEVDEDTTLIDGEFIGSFFYVLAKRSGKVYLLKCDLSDRATDPGLDFKVNLDWRLTESQVTKSYNSTANETTLTLPYTPPSEGFLVVTRTGATGGIGVELDILEVSGNTVKVRGNHSTTPFYAGIRYEQRITLSTLYLRDRRSRNEVVDGRLQLRTLKVQFADTGYLRVEVTPKFGRTSEYKYIGYQLGSRETDLSSIPIGSGTFTVPILANNEEVDIELVNDSWKPSSISGLDWEGMFHSRASRV